MKKKKKTLPTSVKANKPKPAAAASPRVIGILFELSCVYISETIYLRNKKI